MTLVMERTRATRQLKLNTSSRIRLCHAGHSMVTKMVESSIGVEWAHRLIGSIQLKPPPMAIWYSLESRYKPIPEEVTNGSQEEA